MRVWSYFINVVRLYLRYCNLALSIYFAMAFVTVQFIPYLLLLIFLVMVKFIVYVCQHSLSELNSFSALNPDWFIRMNFDSPWYPF
jgi:hypothetical protein